MKLHREVVTDNMVKVSKIIFDTLADVTDVRSWISWWQKVYEKADMTSWLVALSAVDAVKEIPLQINENFKDKNIQSDIKKIVQEITKLLKLSAI